MSLASHTVLWPGFQCFDAVYLVPSRRRSSVAVVQLLLHWHTLAVRFCFCSWFRDQCAFSIWFWDYFSFPICRWCIFLLVRNRSFVWDTAQQLFNTFCARKLSIAIIRMVVVGWVKWMIMYYNPNFPHPTPPNKLFLTIQAFLLPAKICPDQRNLCINSILFSRTLSLFPTSTALP